MRVFRNSYADETGLGGFTLELDWTDPEAPSQERGDQKGGMPSFPRPCMELALFSSFHCNSFVDLLCGRQKHCAKCRRKQVAPQDWKTCHCFKVCLAKAYSAVVVEGLATSWSFARPINSCGCTSMSGPEISQVPSYLISAAKAVSICVHAVCQMHGLEVILIG